MDSFYNCGQIVLLKKSTAKFAAILAIKSVKKISCEQLEAGTASDVATTSIPSHYNPLTHFGMLTTIGGGGGGYVL